jgi:hypothetical protein
MTTIDHSNPVPSIPVHLRQVHLTAGRSQRPPRTAGP